MIRAVARWVGVAPSPVAIVSARLPATSWPGSTVIREPEAAPAAGTGLADGAAGCRAAHLADDGLPVTVVIEDWRRGVCAGGSTDTH